MLFCKRWRCRVYCAIPRSVMNRLPVSVTCDLAISSRQLQAAMDGSRKCTGQRSIDLA